MKNTELQTYFKNKKVFVTGHTGFKGSWLLSWLFRLGANVKGYSLNPQTEDDLYVAINGDSLCTSVIADIRDGERLRDEIISFEPDFIFHLAAQPLVRYSYKFPVETFDVNIQGTYHLLDAIRQFSSPCICVFVTTDKVYENIEANYFYRESDRIGGYDPYSSSKAAAEIVIDSYRKSFFNPSQFSTHRKSISVARAGNVIGGGDWSQDRLMPDIVRSISNASPVQIRRPNSVRPWQHVLDPLSGYLTLAVNQVNDPIKFAQAYNFGPLPEDNLTVKEIVEESIKCWGAGDLMIDDLMEGPHEAGLLQLDVSKAMTELSWKPKINARMSIKKTISWYQNFLTQPNDAFNLINSDIDSYDAQM